MNQQLTPQQVDELISPVPTIRPMSRKEKLLHWAGLIRKLPPHGQLVLFHNLERWKEDMLRGTMLNICNSTAFALAAGESRFNELGLNNQSSMLDAMKFFELSQTDLHEFSCDCGGAITNADMARRIESIANKGEGPVARIVNGITRMW